MIFLVAYGENHWLMCKAHSFTFGTPSSEVERTRNFNLWNYQIMSRMARRSSTCDGESESACHFDFCSSSHRAI